MSENFNYIAFGSQEYVESKVGSIDMSRGRMFEYTPTNIAKRLENLDAASIAFLEKLPTFLCSELMRQISSTFMIVKFGRISEIKLEGKEVSTRFETLIDFGRVEFDDIKKAQEVFEADAFQLYRTHWAVREGTASAILPRLAQLKPGFDNIVAATLKPTPVGLAAKPPPLRNTSIGTANSVEKFLELLYRLPTKGSVETFFRGHEDAQFELTPSLLRKWPGGAWKFMPNEHRLCKELLIAHYDEFSGNHYCFDRLVRMQHYGLPTRLLDVSSNPLIALFFACYSSPKLTRTYGEVIVFRVQADRIKYYDSDTVSCLANLSNLTYAQKNEIDLNLSPKKFNKSNVVQKLLHHIRSEKGFFLDRIVPDDIASIVCVKAKRTNTRIKSQSGAFLLYGHEVTLPESGQEGIDIARVTITSKGHILDQLNRININATTVYPSIEQTTVHLRDQYLVADSA